MKKNKFRKLKDEILEWRDFYGQDISATDKIENAKTIDDLVDVVESHKRFLEDQNSDAISNCEHFIKEIQSHEDEEE
jgi:molecular chaperone GrpE (heat shock protein)